jgi:hypothetical protein
MSTTKKVLVLASMALITLVAIASIVRFAFPSVTGFRPRVHSESANVETAPAPEARPGPGATTEAMQVPAVPEKWEAAVDTILQKVEVGNIAFNTPRNLYVGDPAVMEVRLSRQKSIADLQQKIVEAGAKEGARIQVSREMQASLSGSGFKIEPITPEVQSLSDTEDTEWKWEIKPTEVGNQRLYLTLSALLSVEGQRTPRAVRTFERTIDVSVTWPTRLSAFLAGNWQWLWTTVLIPLWVWTIRRVGKPREQPAGVGDARVMPVWVAPVDLPPAPASEPGGLAPLEVSPLPALMVCPQCKRNLRLPDGLPPGKAVRCPACGARLRPGAGRR